MEFLFVVFERFVVIRKKNRSDLMQEWTRTCFEPLFMWIEEKVVGFIETTRENFFRTGVPVTKKELFGEESKESSNSSTNYSKVLLPNCKRQKTFRRRYDIDFTNLHGEAGGYSRVDHAAQIEALKTALQAYKSETIFLTWTKPACFLTCCEEGSRRR